MFFNAKAFNQNISTWNTSKVCISSFHNFMVQEFSNLSCLGVQVTTMRSMFYKASSFNQDISGWNVSQVTEMRDMFEDSGMSPLPDWYVE